MFDIIHFVFEKNFSLPRYGQTEATAAVTVTDATDHMAGGHVGFPLVCSEVKLVDVPDMYT